MDVDKLVQPSQAGGGPSFELKSCANPFGRVIRLARTNASNPPTVVFIHAADGGMPSYLTLANLVSRTCNAFGIAAVGYRRPRPPPSSLVALAHDYALLLSNSRIRPDVVVGWSSGGWIAFEIAGAIHRSTGGTPAVVVLDTRTQPGRRVPADFKAPRDPNAHADVRLSEKWRHFLHLLTWQAKCPSVPESFWFLTEENKAAFIFKRRADRDFISNSSIIRGLKSAEEIGIVKEIVSMICMSVSDYVPGVYPGDLYVFYSEELGTEPALSAYREAYMRKLWHEKSSRPVTFQLAPGNHGASVNLPFARNVAETIMTVAERGQEKARDLTCKFLA